MIEKIRWGDIEEVIKAIHPRLCQMINSLDKRNLNKLYLAKYPYGANIIDNVGRFRLPDGNFIDELDEPLSSDLSYHHGNMPLGMVLKGQCEAYLEEVDNITGFTQELCNLGVYRQGDFIGYSSFMNNNYLDTTLKPYQMSSGLRSAFIVPGIRNTSRFERLQQGFNGCRKLDMPITIRDHGKLFKKIANHKNFTSPWYAEIIFFPSSWINMIKASNQEEVSGEIHLLKQLFIEQVQRTNCVSGDSPLGTKVWEKIIGHYGQYPYALIDRAKSILLSGMGQQPVYEIASNDDGGPFTTLSSEFCKAFKWRDYVPAIMQPTYLDWVPNRTGYYSMSHCGVNKLDNGAYKSKAADTIKIKDIIDVMMKRAAQFPELLAEVGLSDMLDIDITFHHYDADKTNDMLPSEGLFEGNEDVAQWKKKGKYIAYTNHFLRCCAKITRT